MKNNELAYYAEKLREGDISAFEIIYNETNKQVYNLLYSYTKNEHTSFDLMQETYLTVHSRMGTIKDPCAIKSWINRIAINKANRYFEKNRKEILLSEEGQDLFETQFEEDEEFLPQEILDSKEKQKIIKDIIDNLPIEQKTAVYLYYFDELSLSEVAEDMECSEGTVKSRLNYARKKIKAEVDTWEKKGTKLYGTGVPVLLLLLQNQLGIENISLDKANVLLKNIVNGIGGSGAIGAIHQIGNASLSTKIKGAATATKKAFGIKTAIAGIGVAVTIAGVTYMNKKPEPVDKRLHVNITYSELSMDDGIALVDVLGDDIAIANNFPNDRCIEIIRKDSNESGKADVKLTDVNGKQGVIKLEKSSKNYFSIDTEAKAPNEFIAYKDFTNGTIIKISGYDENIAQIINEPDKKQIEIKALDEGTITAQIVDNKGLKGELELEIKRNNETKELRKEINHIHKCK
ncbi:MAG: RNA polymerase sigma factor [Clostridium beijerinckii]